MFDFEDVQDRAEVLYDILTEEIDRGLETPSFFLQGLKCSVALKSRSISLFKRSFSEQGYDLDIWDIRECYEHFKNELPPGGVGLTEIERNIIEELKERLS